MRNVVDTSEVRHAGSSRPCPVQALTRRDTDDLHVDGAWNK
jgi:hypothetical protein